MKTPNVPRSTDADKAVAFLMFTLKVSLLFADGVILSHGMKGYGRAVPFLMWQGMLCSAQNFSVSRALSSKTPYASCKIDRKSVV